MTLSDLNSIDVLAEDNEGNKKLIMVAGIPWTGEIEALLYIQLIIKLEAIKIYAKNLSERGEKCQIELFNVEEPPISVLSFLNNENVKVSVGIKEIIPAKGQPAKYPNLINNMPDIDTLQKVNAESFRLKYGIDKFDYSLKSLQDLDHLLEQIRFEAGLNPEDENEEFEDGDVIILASAYTGEIIRKEIIGKWNYNPSLPLGIIYFKTENNSQINLIGKVKKYLKYGSSDSVKSLIEIVISKFK